MSVEKIPQTSIEDLEQELDTKVEEAPIDGSVYGRKDEGWQVIPGGTGATKHSELDLDDGTNPHATTQSDVGLDQVDNTADIDKPVSTAQQNALNTKASQTDLNTHVADNANPHSVTQSQVGLGNCDNTADIDKPVSTPQQSALDGKEDGLGNPSVDGQVLASTTGGVRSWVSKDEIDNHSELILDDGTNPHGTTKADVGLDQADNTADVDKPVSTAQQAALNTKADQSSLTSHVNNNLNPHNVTASQVGLGNCDNTADLDKPISDDTQTALDDKEDSLGNPASDGQVLSSLTDGTRSWVDQGETVPGGNDREIQFNDGGSFGGSSNAILESDGNLKLAVSANIPLPPQDQTAGAYIILNDDDKNGLIIDDGLTIPTGLSVGKNYLVFNSGAAAVSITTTGLTVKGNDGNTNISAEGIITIWVYATDSVVIKGDLE